jgi:tetratricopeptide (TPR) repeat protein
MTATIRTLAALLAGACLVPPGSSAQSAASPELALRARGLELGYNLDHAEAIEAFKAAVAANPGEPAAYRSVAAAMWISVLFQQGAITAEDFLGQAGSAAGRTPPAEIAKAFYDALNRAISLAEARLRVAPRDAGALYQLGAAYGFLASYTATVEGRLRASLGPARRAYSAHERVLTLDPARKDAGLIVGLYRYMVATMPAWSRMLAYLAGFGGGRERGIRLVEEAAAFPSDVQPNAKFSLIVIYNREGRHDDALRVIADLQVQFPRNRLLWLESASTALRAGRPAAAVLALEHGLAMLAADPRPRAFGEIARWRYLYGVALASMGQSVRAERELRTALEGEARDSVRGRTHFELGKLATDRRLAATEFHTAANLCARAKDTQCVKESAARLRAAR